MPIPFRDITDVEPTAAVAYLCFMAEPGNGELRAALFIINTRGEPLEFCFTRSTLTVGPLWEPGGAYRCAVAGLSQALFNAVRHQPELLLAQAEEIPSGTFAEDLEVQIPVCLIAGSDGDPASFHWVDGEPEEGSFPAGLVALLRDRKLLLEPFQRAAQGLEEAYARL